MPLSNFNHSSLLVLLAIFVPLESLQYFIITRCLAFLTLIFIEGCIVHNDKSLISSTCYDTVIRPDINQEDDVANFSWPVAPLFNSHTPNVSPFVFPLIRIRINVVLKGHVKDKRGGSKSHIKQIHENPVQATFGILFFSVTYRIPLYVNYYT